MDETYNTNAARISRRQALQAGASLLALTAESGWTAAFAQSGFNPYGGKTNTGPSSADIAAVGKTPAASGAPYVIPTAEGWSSTSVLTVGNSVNGYRMTGIPDGLGAFDNGDGTISVLMNHELGADKSKVRGHGGKGAFVSRWTIDLNTLTVRSGRDFVDSPAKFNLWVDGAWKSADLASEKSRSLTRLCAAELAPISAFYNSASGKGYNGHIFLNGEEGGNANANRAMAWVAADGTAWELPGFGFGKVNDDGDPPPSWENLVANPSTGDATVVLAMSDGGTNQVYVYVGAKQADGTPIQKAGLVGGKLFSIAVPEVKAETRDANIGIAKSLVGKGAGKRFGLAAPNKGTTFLRPEDGAWDPRNPKVFYFVTTDRNNFAADGTVRDGQDVKQVGRTRLWALTFDDLANIATDGKEIGKVELLLDGTEGGDMFDNIAIDKTGVIYLCEDIGNSRHNSKMWTYDTNTGAFATFMRFDPAKFGDIVDGKYTAPVAPYVDDKETSGVLDVTDLFSKASWFRPGSKALLTVVQAHFAYDASDAVGAELVEGGQLLLLVKAA